MEALDRKMSVIRGKIWSLKAQMMTDDRIMLERAINKSMTHPGVTFHFDSPGGTVGSSFDRITE